MSEPSFLTLATERKVVLRAAKVAAVVGTILALINHADHLFNFDMDAATWLKVAMTYAVPYSVSTYSAVGAIRERMEDVRSG